MQEIQVMAAPSARTSWLAATTVGSEMIRRGYATAEVGHAIRLRSHGIDPETIVVTEGDLRWHWRALVTCPWCGDHGCDDEACGPGPCEDCRGEGEIEQRLPARSSVQISPEYRMEACRECGGSGQRPKPYREDHVRDLQIVRRVWGAVVAREVHR